MPLTRRELCLLFPAAVIPSARLSDAAIAAGSAGQDSSLPSATFTFEQLPLDRDSGGGEFRPVLKGKLATGESLEVHETMLPPGGMPHPPHHHVHSEMWLVREGTVELTINGTNHRIGPGGIGFVHSNDEHGIKNVGSTPANYFVVAIGPGAGS
jgi:mannose-6-phosphate isomerase-like protein (cupin superfamily)